MLQKIWDALFAPPELYRQKYAAITAKQTIRTPQLQLEPGGKAAQYANRSFITGGALEMRLRVLKGTIAQQLEEGRGVVVLQPAAMPVYRLTEGPQTCLAVPNGGYDPLQGRSDAEGVSLFQKVLTGLGMQPAEVAKTTNALSDEFHILWENRALNLSSFTAHSSREWSRKAFQEGNDLIAESHSEPSAQNTLDWLRGQLCFHQTSSQPGCSLRETVKPGSVTVLQFPVGKDPWILFALNELSEFWMPTSVFAVFLDAYLHDDCRPLVEGLTCGRCFCYQDLPSQPWLWQAATTSCIAGCVFRHMGESAQTISRYFGQTKVRKRTQTDARAVADCDTGGLMGLFGSTTVTESTGQSETYEWEAAVPEEAIAGLPEDEAIFIYNGTHERWRIV